jgi:hypothetical protein
LKIIAISYKRVLSVAILLLVFLPGCGTTKAKHTISDEEGLRERVMAYWNYRVDRDLVKSYEYEVPLDRMTLTNYIRKYSNPMITYKSFSLQSISKKDVDVADVNLTVVPVVKVPGGRAFEHKTIVTERWVRVKDIWYHIPKRVSGNLIHKKEEGGDGKD